MDGVYNRKLFAKKASEARDRLREIGGVPPMPQQQMPSGMGGILASSPELMQAAMRKAVVLPVHEQMMMQEPMTKRLPPSSPLPNIAGIAPAVPQPQPQPQQPPQQAPRPSAPGPQQPPVRKMAEGGSVTPGYADLMGRMAGINPVAAPVFLAAKDFAQRALTSAKPEELGLPPGVPERLRMELEDPETAADGLIEDIVPEDEVTGDKQNDILKAAEIAGVTDVPQGASLDDINKAIVGAKLGAAIAGSYVNPNTGQELRPTAGARIAGAVAEGLMAPRETAATREAQAQAMELAKMQIASNERIAGMRGAGGGSGISPLEPFPDAVRDLAGKIISSQGLQITADEAMQQAIAALAPLYGIDTGGGSAEELPVISTKEQRDALDTTSGPVMYIDASDGKVYTKPQG